MGLTTAKPGATDWAMRHSVVLAALGLAIVSLAAQLAGDELIGALRYERAAVQSGEWWRLVSANVVHLGVSHWLLNALALLMIALLFHRDATFGGAAFATLIAALAVTVGLHYASPSLDWYVGLSGVLHGLVAAGILTTKTAWRRVDTWLLAAGLLAKVLWEQRYGAMPGSESLAGGPVVVDAHAFGAGGGALAALILRGWERRARSV